MLVHLDTSDQPWDHFKAWFLGKTTALLYSIWELFAFNSDHFIIFNKDYILKVLEEFKYTYRKYLAQNQDFFQAYVVLSQGRMEIFGLEIEVTG